MRSYVQVRLKQPAKEDVLQASIALPWFESIANGHDRDFITQVPTLQTPEGGVWESNAIARYVARLSDKGLFGSTVFETVS